MQLFCRRSFSTNKQNSKSWESRSMNDLMNKTSLIDENCLSIDNCPNQAMRNRHQSARPVQRRHTTLSSFSRWNLGPRPEPPNYSQYN